MQIRPQPVHCAIKHKYGTLQVQMVGRDSSWSSRQVLKVTQSEAIGVCIGSTIHAHTVHGENEYVFAL